MTLVHADPVRNISFVMEKSPSASEYPRPTEVLYRSIRQIIFAHFRLS